MVFRFSVSAASTDPMLKSTGTLMEGSLGKRFESRAAKLAEITCCSGMVRIAWKEVGGTKGDMCSQRSCRRWPVNALISRHKEKTFGKQCLQIESSRRSRCKVKHLLYQSNTWRVCDKHVSELNANAVSISQLYFPAAAYNSAQLDSIHPRDNIWLQLDGRIPDWDVYVNKTQL